MTETEAIRENYNLGVLAGEAREQQRIIKLLDNLMDFETDTQRRIDHKLALQVLKDALIKGEK